jgi:Tfp pilus assembly protein PilZ
MKVAAGVHLKFGDVDELIAFKTADISKAGLFIRMPVPKPVGTEVLLKLEVGAQRFDLQGVVVRIVPDPDDPTPEPGPTGIGVHLTKSTEGWDEFCDLLHERRKSKGLEDDTVDIDLSDL